MRRRTNGAPRFFADCAGVLARAAACNVWIAARIEKQHVPALRLQHARAVCNGLGLVEA